MTDGLDVVTVGIENVRAVVAGVVRPFSRSAVVSTPCGDRGGVEAIDGLIARGPEREVDWTARRRIIAQEQFANLDCVLAFPRDAESESADRGFVEAPTRGEVTHPQMDVVEEQPVLVTHTASIASRRLAGR